MPVSAISHHLQKNVSDERVDQMYASINEQLRESLVEKQRKQPAKEIQPPVSGQPMQPQQEHPVAPFPSNKSKEPIRPKPDKGGKRRVERAEMISAGRRKAASLAQAGNLNGAIGVLEKLSKQYPNSSDLRRDLEAARSELVYQRQFGVREERNERGWTSRMRN